MINTKAAVDYIVTWLQDYSTKAKTQGFVIGISGGVDSAVTSTLCAMTGLPLICLEMPIHQNVSQVSRARKHIDNLRASFDNVTSEIIELTPIFDTFVDALPDAPTTEQKNMSLVNTRARLRMTTLYYFAGLENYLVAGTGNKVEDFGVGFFTKYGDGGVDLSPIADLSKTEVYAIGKELGVSDEILGAAPTDGLWGDDRTDEDQIGASYPELEWAMEFDGDPLSLNARQLEVLQIYKTLNEKNQHKMQPIPVCKLPDTIRT